MNDNSPFRILVDTVIEGDFSKFKRTLEEHPDVELADARGFSLLHLAAQENRPNFIEYLLNAGVSPDIMDDEGVSPLHVAVGEGHFEAVQALIKSGCAVDLRCPSNDHSTPLHVAAVWNRMQVAKLLLASGAEVNVRDSEGNTPLKLAIINENKDMAAWLKIAGGIE